MPDSPTTGSPSTAGRDGGADRLESWKEIAAYMRRDVTTVQRWEKREGMPVRRHLHDKAGSVYAFRADLDAWAASRSPGGAASEPALEGALPANGGAESRDAALDDPVDAPRAPAAAPARPPRPRWRASVWALVAAAIAISAAAGWELQRRRAAPPDDPLARAHFRPLTEFDGIEQAAAVSRDGKFVAFQSDRDGRMDVWVTQVGTGQFVNLTRGGAPELVNPSIRTIGFSPDGTLVTFWARTPRGNAAPDIGVWAVPLLGGPPRPYLEGVAEFDWSGDGARLVYHTPGPGDPMYVRDVGAPAEPRNVFTAPAGLHAHFLVWSPDGEFVYFVQGALPDRLDLWRVRPGGGTPERITRHDAVVSHPVFVGTRALLYLATDADGSGPWIWALDLDRGAPRRLGAGVDAYTSLSASGDGRRVVATKVSPKRTLWRVPLAATQADLSARRRVHLTTSDGSAPRLGPGYLVYVSSKGAGDGVWKLQDGAATELWSAPDARVIGAPAIRPDGGRVAFTVRQGGRTALWVVNADGSEGRLLTRALDVQGAPAWTRDGRSVTVGAVVDGAPRLFQVPADGGAPARLVAEHSVDPAWSPGGDVVAFSGADVGTTFPVRAVRADGTPYPIPALTLTRGARHLAFLPGSRSLVVLRGAIRHKNVWLVDLDTGAERQLTDVPAEFDVRDFDVSPDGRELVLEQVQEHSDVVLVDVPPRG